MSNPDVYQKITNRLIAMIEAGPAEWRKSWSSFSQKLPRRANGERYSGVNVLELWFTAQERGYANPTWMTYKQAQSLGGTVRKGEKGARVVYASKFTKEQPDGSQRSIPFMREYAVFNVEQVDGLPAQFELVPLIVNHEERVAEAEAFFDRIPVTLRHGGGRAFYSPSEDFVQLPQFESFKSAEAYYSTRAHEMVHWSGAEKRLNRTLTGRFGDSEYALEELIAELGAAFTMAHLSLAPEPREDHASYLAHWLRALKSDPKAVVTAASAAGKAMDYLIEAAAPAALQEAAA